jgi:hypothetical protein
MADFIIIIAGPYLAHIILVIVMSKVYGVYCGCSRAPNSPHWEEYDPNLTPAATVMSPIDPQPHAGRHGDEPDRTVPLWKRRGVTCLASDRTGHAALHGEFHGIRPGQTSSAASLTTTGLCVTANPCNRLLSKLQNRSARNQERYVDFLIKLGFFRLGRKLVTGPITLPPPCQMDDVIEK